MLRNVTQTLTLAALLTPFAVAAAGCGGSKTPSVASLGTTSTSTTGAAGVGAATAARPSTAALAACFESHGFAASVGSAATAPSRALSILGVTIGGNVNPDSPQFQAALQACRKFLPGGGPPSLTPAEQSAAAKAMLNFASCMRKDGVPSFPDPDGRGRFPFASISTLDPSTPLFQHAFKSCQSLEPKVGPRVRFG